MANDSLRKALESIGHSKLLQKFEDEDMDDEALDICVKDESSRNELKVIFGKQGTVLKFLSAYKKLRNEAGGEETNDQAHNSRGRNHTTSTQQPESTKQRPGNKQAHSLPVPIQIIDLILKGKSNTETKLSLKEDNLARILKNVKNRRVAVLSIAGPSRLGKSFILSYMIKYLRHNSQGAHSSDWMGEGEPERGAPLQDAFPWRNGVDPETTGISMWPEPFTLTSRDGSEFDVLLVDTQGVFDHFTEDKDWATIVGLSLLTSSALIFNISKHLQEDTLKSLKGFMDFGQMAIDSNDGGEKPFQSLTFLIRDWNNPGDFDYGARGGADFLKYYLNQRHTNGGSEMRDQIKNSFEQVNCFLLPDPGETVKDNNYDGSVAGMAPKFASNIKDFIEFLFNSNTFPVKTISGNPVTGRDLLTYFKNYVEIFNSDKVPSSDDMNRAMTTICNTTVLNKCIAVYEATFEKLKSQVQRSFLLETELQDIHEAGVKDAIGIFDNSRKMGAKYDVNKSRSELQNPKLKDLLDNFTLHNREAFRTAVNTEVESLKKNFEASVYKQISSHLSTAPAAHKFLSDDSLQKILQECEKEAIQSFQSNLGLPNLDCVQSDMEGIFSAIQTIRKAVIQTNESTQSEAESTFRASLQKMLDAFSGQLTQGTQGKYVETTAFEELVDGAFEKIKSEFSEKYQTSSFFQEGEAHLLGKVASLRREFLQKIEEHNNFLAMKCTEPMSEAEGKYGREMDREFKSGNLLEAFSKCHQDAENNSLESFTDSDSAQKLPPGVLKGFKSDLLSRLASRAAQFAQRSLNEKKKRLLTQLQDSLSTQDANFDLDEILTDISTLKQLHDELVQKVMDNFGHLLNDIRSTGIVNVDTDDAIQTQLMSDINNEIERHKRKHEEKNARLRGKYESQITHISQKSAETYAGNIKHITSIDSQDQFKTKALVMMETTIADFEKECGSCPNSSTLSPTLLPTFLNDFRAELGKRMNLELELVKLKLMQDEAEIKYAIPEIKRAYKEEMEKIFNAKKDKVSFQELRYHHTNISRDVLDKYKRDKYPLPRSRQKEVQEELDVHHKGFKERVKRQKTQIIPAIGIDLGTTYSCVAVIKSGQVEVIKNTLGDSTTPSYVYFPEGGGRPVVAGAKEEAFKDPDNTVFDAKRLIGRKMTDVVVQEDMKLWPFKLVNDGDSPKIQIRGRNLDPVQISSFILMYLKQSAEKRLHLPGQIQNAVITVPAYFSNAQRQATKDAGEIAGLNVLKIVNEPTAAAIAYGLDFHDDLHKNVLIFDLGGGTFDVAVLHMKKGKINVKAIGGDTHLGGEDFDSQLVTYCLEEFKRKSGVDLMSIDYLRSKVLRRLRNECEKMKCQLSEKTAVNIRVEKIKDNHDLDVGVRREVFEGLCAPMFQKCITEVEKTLKDAKLDKTEIDDVVLVGGSTRIPKIMEMIGKYFNGKTLMQTKSSDEIVAHGAAILACSLNPGQDEDKEFDIQLREVTPFSLGTDTLGDNLSIIIPKNTVIPCTQTRGYVTTANSQKKIDVVIYEGENPRASKNRELGKFSLQGIPPAPAGQEKCTVTMDVSSENILTVTAMGMSRGNKESIKITSHTGRLNREQIEAMKLENGSLSFVKASRKTVTGPRKVPPQRQLSNHEDDEGNNSDW